MAEVTGSIGNENVILDNAATEATLKQLLQATIAAGTKNTKALEEIAKSSGLDPKTVQKVNKELDEEAPKIKKVNVELEINKTLLLDFGKKLIDGTAQASDVFNALSLLPGPLGFVAQGFSLLSKYQEENFQAYQKLTNAGVNFGGSLSNMRIAAANSYMTLQEFGEVVSKHSKTLAMMGGNANNGAVALSQLSKTLLSSPIGRELMAMGYTTKEVNEGMLNYIQMTGGRSSAELKGASSMKAITDASAEYLTQLDGLARLTGESREKQQEELAAASKNAAFQSYLQGLDEDSRKKAMAGMANAMALGGKGAVDAFQSKLMGVAPDKAGAIFTSTASELAGVVSKSADMVGDSTKNITDMNKTVGEGYRAAQRDAAKYGKETLYAIIRQGGPLAESLQKMGITANKAATMTDKEIEEALKKAELAKTEADSMAAANQGLKELSQAVIQLISPVVQLLTPALKFVGEIAGSVGKFLSDLPGPIKTVISIFGTLAAAMIVYKARVAAQAAAETAKSAAGTAAGVGEKLAGGAAGGAGGGGFVAFIRTLGRTLASLAPIAVPMLIGAGAVAGVVAILGAGVAAAIALIGVSLPVFAKGLKELAEIDGMNLAKIALGLIALGPALMVFTASSFISGIGAVGTRIANFFSGGGPISLIQESVLKLSPILPQMSALGPALNTYAQGLAAYGDAISRIDIAKAERVKQVLKGPGVLEGIGSAIKEVGTATANIISNSNEKQGNDMQALNTRVGELVRLTKELVDYNKRQLDATKSLNGNVFA